MLVVFAMSNLHNRANRMHRGWYNKETQGAQNCFIQYSCTRCFIFTNMVKHLRM